MYRRDGMKFNILGVEYTVEYVKDHGSMFDIKNSGECDYSDKLIRVAESCDGEKYSNEWKQETLYHELAHAFLYETGQSDLNDERHAELLGKFANFIVRNKL